MVPATNAQVAGWQADAPEAWAQESIALRDQVYDVPQDREVGYDYSYRNFDTVQWRRLLATMHPAQWPLSATDRADAASCICLQRTASEYSTRPPGGQSDAVEPHRFSREQALNERSFKLRCYACCY